MKGAWQALRAGQGSLPILPIQVTVLLSVALTFWLNIQLRNQLISFVMLLEISTIVLNLILLELLRRLR